MNQVSMNYQASRLVLKRGSEQRAIVEEQQEGARSGERIMMALSMS